MGKSSTAAALAEMRPRAACIDVDDVRQLVRSGGAAPWAGEEGRRQQSLGVQNACALARRFLRAEFDVVISDVVTTATAPLYRRLLPGVVLIRLVVPIEEARRRAATREVWLTDQEFDDLHTADRQNPPLVDHDITVRDFTLPQQAAAIEAMWMGYHW